MTLSMIKEGNWDPGELLPFINKKHDNQILVLLYFMLKSLF